MVFTNFSQYANVLRNFGVSHNLYIGVNPTTNFRLMRPSSEHIPFVSSILIDIDPHPSAGVIPRNGRYGEVLADFFEDMVGLPRTTSHVLIHSGRGLQLVYPVVDAPLLTSALRTEWSAALAHFLHTIGKADLPVPGRIDPAVSDLARVRRAVWSVNQKTGQMAVPLYAQDTGNYIRFNDFVRKWTPKTFPESIAPATHPKLWWKSFRYFPVTARKFLTEEVPEGERNHDAFCAAASLLDAGADEATVHSVMQKANGRQGKPLELTELSRIISNAIKKGKTNAAL